MKKEFVTLALSEIIPYENNPRINDEAVGDVVESIKQCENLDPIEIDENNVILAGHTRLKALQELGYTETECIRYSGLTEEQKKKYRLLSNKTGEKAEWDLEKLKIELADLDFGDFDFGFYLPEDKEKVEIVEVELPEEVETRCKLGDVWQLGEHRLICGDSTDSAVIDRLMDGVKADISITSPPYNAGHMDVPKSESRGGGTQKSTQKKYLLDNDKRTDDEYFDFLCENINILLTYSDEVFYNIGVASGSKTAITRLLNKYANQFKELIYWVKENPMPVIVESVISSATELIMCFGENGTRSFNHFNDRMFHGVISGMSASTYNKYADIHKATFPVYLPSEIIKRFTPDNGSVLDCFGGTGTTMIACEQLKRKCYMCELDPHYCDVIIQRWENFTGKEAVLIGEGK